MFLRTRLPRVPDYRCGPPLPVGRRISALSICVPKAITICTRPELAAVVNNANGYLRLDECPPQTGEVAPLSNTASLVGSPSCFGAAGMVRLKCSETPGGDWEMAAAQAGDTVAYRALLVALASWLRRYYLRRLPPVMTEDAVQDALLAIHEKRHTYDPSRPFGPWLAAIARYKWIDRLRARKSQATEPLDENIAVADHGEAIVAGSALHQLLDGLKPAQADVIRLVKIEGYSIVEASKATGQSVSLVKVNIHRGLEHSASVLRKIDDAY